MNHIVGPLIVLVVGAVAGILFHSFWRRFWVASALATLAATALWVGGCYVFLAIAAPSELGLPLLGPILLTIAISFTGVLVAGGVVSIVRSRKPANRTNSPPG